MDMEGLSPNIPIRNDYSDYIYDEEGIADTARTEASSTRDFKYEHGRRYHAYREGSYPMPNDDLNTEHEKIAHHMWGILLQDRLYLPPIDEPTHVIDLGTGQGLWALDMAERYPDAQILGLDLTPPPQSLYNNLQFQVDDFTQEWMPNEGYDLAHLRGLTGSVQDWPALYSTIFKNLKSGGYVQQMEIEIKPQCDDGTLPDNSIYHKWADLAQELTGAGTNFTFTGRMKRQLEEAGFVDVVELRLKLPLGPWSSNPVYQDLGRYFEMYWRTGSQGWLLGACTRNLGWTASQVNSQVEDVFAQIDSRTAHVYYDVVIVYGKKP